MDRYSLEWASLHIDSLIDKMGSDYFPIKIKLERFITMTYDFIRENTQYLEANQEISDDLKTLLIRFKSGLVKDDEIHSSNVWNVPEPADYCRLVSIVPMVYDDVTKHDMVKAKDVKIIKEGQANAYNRDPFREATAEYPSVQRIANMFKIDVGRDTTIYNKALLAYIKEPTFAKISNTQERIVNLPNIAIEKICLNTADSLRITTGDATSAPNVQYNSSFGKKGK